MISELPRKICEERRRLESRDERFRFRTHHGWLLLGSLLASFYFWLSNVGTRDMVICFARFSKVESQEEKQSSTGKNIFRTSLAIAFASLSEVRLIKREKQSSRGIFQIPPA